MIPELSFTFRFSATRSSRVGYVIGTGNRDRGLLRVALLGCGGIARLAHLRSLRESPIAQVVGIADPDPGARALAVREAPGAAAFESFTSAIAGSEFDAAVIALPTMLHAEAALACLKRGAHVYVEKPIATSADSARLVHEEWRRTSLVGRMGFNGRFTPLNVQLRHALKKGDAGEPVAVRSVFTTARPASDSWRGSADSGGGALLDLASHHLDTLRFLFDDEISSVSADIWTERESAMLRIVMQGGLRAQILVSYGTVEEDSLEVFCTTAKLRVSRYDSLTVEQSGVHPTGGVAGSAIRLANQVAAAGYSVRKIRSPGGDPSFAESMSRFLVAARDGKPAGPDLTDGLRAAEAIDAARASAAERRTIDLF